MLWLLVKHTNVENKASLETKHVLDLDLLSLGRSNNDGLSTIKDKKLKLVLRRVAAKNIGFVTLF